jgi:methyl-accepting chemotaxis protein
VTMEPEQTEQYTGVAPSIPAQPQASSRFARSGLFWRMMSGALIAFVMALVTAGLSLWVISYLVQETDQMRTAAASAADVQRLSTALGSSYATLELLPDAGYQQRFYQLQHDNAMSARLTLSRTQVPAAYSTRLRDILTRFDTLEPALQDLNQLGATNRPQAIDRWQNTYRGQLFALNQDVEGLAVDLNKAAGTAVVDMSSGQEMARIAIPVISIAGLLLGLLLALLLLRGTVQRIRGVSADLARLANGDLTPPHRLRNTAPRRQSGFFSDEVLALEQDYLRTIERLRAPLQRIQEDAARISASSTEISSAATHQAAGSSQQATAITEVTVTVEQLNQTAVQIADAAASVASAAEQALVSASRGQEAVRDSIIGMAMIRSRVNDITARILALSAQSQRISDIIDVIDDMAARTHILALNAAVESAGAGGEVGERFGVVASEVKKLAQRSAGATREVRAVIAQVQAATNAAVMATEDGLKETEKGVQMAHQSGDANEDIIQMVERTAQLANAISLATQQQRTASEQVVGTMREIAQVTRQAATSSEQASRAASELSDIAQELRTVSAGFRVEHDGEELPPADAGTRYSAPRLATGEGAA